MSIHQFRQFIELLVCDGVADASGLSRSDATKAVEGVFDTITTALSKGAEVRLVGDAGYPEAARDFEASFDRLDALRADIFLGSQTAVGIDGVTRDFYIRQLQDWKGSLPVEAMIPKGMRLYGELCAWTLARASSSEGSRSGASPRATAPPTSTSAIGSRSRSSRSRNAWRPTTGRRAPRSGTCAT